MKQILVLTLFTVLFSNCGKEANKNPKTVPAKVQWDGYTLTGEMEKYVVIDTYGGSIRIPDEPSFIPLAKQKIDEYFDLIRTEYWNFDESDKTAYTELYSGGNWAGLQSYTYKVTGDQILVTSAVSGGSFQLFLTSSELITVPSYMIIDQHKGSSKEEAELGSGFYTVGTPSNEKDTYIRFDILGNGLSIHDTVYVTKINISYKAI